MKLTSREFPHEGQIPSKYTCDGENINPPLKFEGVPKEAQSLVLIMDDPDAIKPAGHVWDHWIVWNISPELSSIEEGQEPNGVHGETSGGGLEYEGPCPPDGEHIYQFKLYALDNRLTLSEGSSKENVLNAMEGHIIKKTELLGRYMKK